MRQLKPDNVVAKTYRSDYLILERELHKRYKKFRIPQTEYFRLDDYHLKEVMQIISQLDYPKSIIKWIFIKSLLLIILIFLPLFILISLNFNDINMVILKTIIWMERISLGFSCFSVFVHSGRYLGFLSELKFRISRLIVFIIFSLCFRIASYFFQ